MIFRRIKAHIEKENWFAVAVDFFIVVVGVFIGIQVANWNEEQTLIKTETELLFDLREEIETSIAITEQKLQSYVQVVAAGKRSLNFLSSNVSCGSECWPILVDFMHASQWQQVTVLRPTYDNMRGLGLPKDRAIVESIETYLAQADAAIPAFAVLPPYRTMVRQLMPLQAQEFYWLNCYSVDGGLESYVLGCPKGVSDDVALQIVDSIAQNNQIKPNLTNWIGGLVMLPISLGIQNKAGESALEMIDAELNRRQ